MIKKTAEDVARENALVEGAAKLYPVLELECEGKKAVCVGGHADDIDSINVIADGKVVLISEWVLEHCLGLPGGTTNKAAEDCRLTLTKPCVVAYGNQHVDKTPLLQWCRDMCVANRVQDLRPGSHVLVFWWDMEHSKQQDKMHMQGHSWWPAVYVPKHDRYGVWFSAQVVKYDKKLARLHVVYDYNKPDELEYGTVILPLNYVHFGDSPPAPGRLAQVFPPPWEPPPPALVPQQQQQLVDRTVQPPKVEGGGAQAKVETDKHQQQQAQEPTVQQQHQPLLQPQPQSSLRQDKVAIRKKGAVNQQHGLLMSAADGQGLLSLTPPQQQQESSADGAGCLQPSTQQMVPTQLPLKPESTLLQVQQKAQAAVESPLAAQTANKSSGPRPKTSTGAAAVAAPQPPMAVFAPSSKPASVALLKAAGTGTSTGAEGATTTGRGRTTWVLDDLDGGDDSSAWQDTGRPRVKRVKVSDKAVSLVPTPSGQQQHPLAAGQPDAPLAGSAGSLSGKHQQMTANAHQQGLPPRPPNRPPLLTGMMGAGGASSSASLGNTVKRKQPGANISKLQPSRASPAGSQSELMAGAAGQSTAAASLGGQQPQQDIISALAAAEGTAAVSTGVGVSIKAGTAASPGTAAGMQASKASSSQETMSAGSRGVAQGGSFHDPHQAPKPSSKGEGPQQQQQQQHQGKHKQAKPKKDQRSSVPQPSGGVGTGPAKGPAGQPPSSSTGLAGRQLEGVGAGQSATGGEGVAMDMDKPAEVEVSPLLKMSLTMGPTSRVVWPGNKQQAAWKAAELVSRPAEAASITPALCEVYVKALAAKGVRGSSSSAAIMLHCQPPPPAGNGEHLQPQAGTSPQGPAAKPSKRKRTAAAVADATVAAAVAVANVTVAAAANITVAAAADVMVAAATATDVMMAASATTDIMEVAAATTDTTAAVVAETNVMAAAAVTDAAVTDAAVTDVMVLADTNVATESQPVDGAAAAVNAGVMASTCMATGAQTPAALAATAATTAAAMNAGVVDDAVATVGWQAASRPAAAVGAASSTPAATTTGPTLAGCFASLRDAMTHLGSVAAGSVSKPLQSPAATAVHGSHQQQQQLAVGTSSDNGDTATAGATATTVMAMAAGGGSGGITAVAGSGAGRLPPVAAGGGASTSTTIAAAMALPPPQFPQHPRQQQQPPPASPGSSGDGCESDSESDGAFAFVDNRQYSMMLPPHERLAAYEALVLERHQDSPTAVPQQQPPTRGVEQ